MVWSIIGLAVNPSNVYTNANVNASSSSLPSPIISTLPWIWNISNRKSIQNFNWLWLNPHVGMANMKYLSSRIVKTLGIGKKSSQFILGLYCIERIVVQHNWCIVFIVWQQPLNNRIPKQYTTKHISNNYFWCNAVNKRKEKSKHYYWRMVWAQNWNLNETLHFYSHIFFTFSIK